MRGEEKKRERESVRGKKRDYLTDVFEQLGDVVQEAPEELGVPLALLCAQGARRQRGTRGRAPGQAHQLHQQQQQHGAIGICMERGVRERVKEQKTCTVVRIVEVG